MRSINHEKEPQANKSNFKLDLFTSRHQTGIISEDRKI